MSLIFSIIIPAYNIGHLVEDAIYSCLRQQGISQDEIEIIVVNDGSTDDTLEYINQFKRSYNVVILNQKNGGLSNARNNGFELAHGKYIIFLDGDDWLAKDALAELKPLLQEDKVIQFPLEYWYSPENHNAKNSGIVPGIYDSKEFLRITLGRSLFSEIPAPKKCYPRKLLIDHKIKFVEGILHEDNPFYADVMMAVQTVCYIDKPLYYYRQNRNGSITSKLTQRNFNGIVNGNDYLIGKYGFSNPDILNMINCNYIFQIAMSRPGQLQEEMFRYFRTHKIKFRLFKSLVFARRNFKAQLKTFILAIDPWLLWHLMRFA